MSSHTVEAFQFSQRGGMRCSIQANCTFRNTVVFLPKEPYLGTCKHYSILKVQRNENKDTIDEYRCQVFQLGEGVYPPHPGPKQGTLFIPMTGSQGPSSDLRDNTPLWYDYRDKTHHH